MGNLFESNSIVGWWLKNFTHLYWSAVSYRVLRMVLGYIARSTWLFIRLVSWYCVWFGTAYLILMPVLVVRIIEGMTGLYVLRANFLRPVLRRAPPAIQQAFIAHLRDDAPPDDANGDENVRPPVEQAALEQNADEETEQVVLEQKTDDESALGHAESSPLGLQGLRCRVGVVDPDSLSFRTRYGLLGPTLGDASAAEQAKRVEISRLRAKSHKLSQVEQAKRDEILRLRARVAELESETKARELENEARDVRLAELKREADERARGLLRSLADWAKVRKTNVQDLISLRLPAEFHHTIL